MKQKQTGSTAIYMTYGDYLRDYPKGQKHENAKPDEYGYCMINNENKKYICWLKESTFHLINNGLAAIREMEEDPTGKKAKAKAKAEAKKLKRFIEKQQQLREKEEERERKERAYIVQARDEFSDLMLNATAAQWAAILRLIKTVHKDAETIWLMTNEWKEKQKAARTSKSKKRHSK